MTVTSGSDTDTGEVGLEGEAAPEFEERGESLSVLERVIVAPALGVFQPLPPETVTAEGEIVTEGQAIGTVECSGATVAARSKFAGFMMGLLARPGERVREGQPLAWVRLLEPA